MTQPRGHGGILQRLARRDYLDANNNIQCLPRRSNSFQAIFVEHGSLAGCSCAEFSWNSPATCDRYAGPVKLTCRRWASGRSMNHPASPRGRLPSVSRGAAGPISRFIHMRFGSRHILDTRFSDHDGRLNHAIGYFITFVFFLSFLVVGLSTYRAYGIHVDENTNRTFGEIWCQYVKRVLSSGTIPPVDDYIGRLADHNMCHGPLWEFSLRFIQELVVRRDAPPRETILTRHLATFLLFYVSAIFFFLTCKHIFRGLVFPLLGTLIYITHTRIFAHSYYNSVDIGFLSFFSISLYTCLRFLEAPGLRTGFCHGIGCALVADTRIAGLVVPVTTMLIFVVESVTSTNLAGNWRRLAGYFPPLWSTFAGRWCCSGLFSGPTRSRISSRH